MDSQNNNNKMEEAAKGVVSSSFENITSHVQNLVVCRVQRTKSNQNDTLGEMFIKDSYVCLTLEDEYREVKVKGETRIPCGIYKIKLRTEGGHHQRYLDRYGSDWHKGMIEICDVPNFKYILIHIGNTEDDTDGCVLTGTSSVWDNKTKRTTITESRVAYEKVYPLLRDCILENPDVDVFIEIKD